MRKKTVAVILMCIMFVLCVSACADGKAHEHKLEFVKEVPATCAAEGKIAHWHCDGCGKNFSDNTAVREITDTAIPKTDRHDWDKSQYVYLEPGCFTDGYSRVPCSVCGEIDEYIFRARGKHEFSRAWSHDSAYHWHDSVCGHDAIDGKALHTSGKTCSVCGYVRTETEGLRYRLNEDKKSYSVIGIGSVTETDIFIPATHDGFPVTAIAEQAFKGSKITSLSMADNVEEIGYAACIGSYDLVSVKVGKGVKSVKEAVFGMCHSLKSLTVEDGNETFIAVNNCLIEKKTKTLISACVSSVIPTDGTVTKIANCAFMFGQMESLVIPDRITEIELEAFINCENLKSLTIGSGLKDMCVLAFWYSDLTEITVSEENATFYSVGNSVIERATGTLVLGSKNSVIPSDGSVTKIGQYAFSGCRIESVFIPACIDEIESTAFSYGNNSLTSITVDAANPKYHSDGNCLIDTERKTLVTGCPVSVIPSDGSVTKLDTYAFEGCKKMKSIEIPACVTEIKGYTFMQCESLETFTVPDGVTDLGYDTFANCYSLKSIYIPLSVEFVHDGVFQQCCSLIAYCEAPSKPDGWSYEWSYDIAGVVWDYKNVTADNGTVYTVEDGVHYRIDGGRAYVCKQAYNLEKAVIKSEVVYDGKTYPVVGIDDSAFIRCPALVSVTLPSSLESIGASAFGGMCVLEEIYFEGGVGDWCEIDGLGNIMNAERRLFVGGKELSGKIIIPEGTSAIEEYAFYNCKNITGVSIPSSVTEIGNYAFYNCGIGQITVPDSVSFTGDYAFDECPIETAVIPACAAKAVGNSGRWGAEPLLTMVKITSGTALSDFAFSGCGALLSVEIAESVTSFGNYSFRSCVNLESLTVPKGVTRFTEYMFQNCRIKNIYYSGSIEEWLAIEGHRYLMEYGRHILHIGGRELSGELVIPDGITAVPEYAFDGVEKITSVRIPASVVSVGESALRMEGTFDKYYGGDIAGWCRIEGLKNIQSSFNSEKNRLFIGGEEIKGELVLPDTVTKIGDYAFAYLGSVTSVKISGTVTEIGDKAFYDCNGISSISIPDSVRTIGDYAFYSCGSLTNLTVSSAAESIGMKAFYDCPIETAVIPVAAASDLPKERLETLTVIGVQGIPDGTFKDCTVLKSVTIDESVATVGVRAFTNCPIETAVIPAHAAYAVSNSALKNVTVTGGIVPSNAFSGCPIENAVIEASAIAAIAKSSLKTVIITGGDSIENGAFAACSSLTDITVASGNAKYHSEGNCVIETASKTLVTGCKTSVIPTDGSVTAIADSAFENCASLKNIAIPNTVESLGVSAFSRCTSLESITVPESVKIVSQNAFYGCTALQTANISASTVGDCAFYDCTSLKNLHIFAGMTSIGFMAFENCTALESVIIPEGVTHIEGFAFRGCTSLTRVVLPNSLTALGNIYTWQRSLPFEGCPIENATLPLNAMKAVPKENLTALVITNGETVADRAFAECTNLVNITLPDSIVTVGKGIFTELYNIENIYYTGSLADWCSIDWKNGIMGEGDYGWTAYDRKLYIDGAEIKGELVIPSSVKKINAYAFAAVYGITSVKISDGVESIGDYAFYCIGSLTSVTVADSVKVIASSAFDNYSIETAYVPAEFAVCFGSESLKTLVVTSGTRISSNYRVFGSVKNLVIPDSVTKIDSIAFYKCSVENATVPAFAVSSIANENLKTLVITSGTNISGLENCSSLISITVKEGNERYRTDGNCLIETATKTLVFGCKTSVIPTDGSVTVIGFGAFKNCVSLSEITIPRTVTRVESGAFSGCSALERITVEEGNGKYHSSGNCLIETEAKALVAGCKTSVIPTDGSVTTIRSRAFSGTSLVSINIPEGVTKIGQESFFGCTSLESVIISASVTVIETNIFKGCSALEKITVKDGNEKYHSSGNCLIETEAKALVAGCKTSVIPTDGSVTTIGRGFGGVFEYIDSLTSIAIPKSVTEIRGYAFSGCVNLTDIYYDGTSEEWQAIVKGYGWDSDTGEYTVHCTDGDAAK